MLADEMEGRGARQALAGAVTERRRPAVNCSRPDQELGQVRWNLRRWRMEALHWAWAQKRAREKCCLWWLCRQFLAIDPMLRRQAGPRGRRRPADWSVWRLP